MEVLMKKVFFTGYRTTNQDKTKGRKCHRPFS